MRVKELFEMIGNDELFSGFIEIYEARSITPLDDEAKCVVKRLFMKTMDEISKLKENLSDSTLILMNNRFDINRENGEIFRVEDADIRKIDDAVLEKDFEKIYDAVPTYAIEFDDWKDILGYKVSSLSVKEYGITKFASYVLYEMTFFGFTYESVQKRVKEEMNILSSRIDAILNGSEQVKTTELDLDNIEETDKDIEDLIKNDMLNRAKYFKELKKELL